MNVEKLLIERDISQKERDIGIFWKSGLGLIVLDIALMMIKIAKPGRWLNDWVGDWIYPVVIGLGSFVMILAIPFAWSLASYYRTQPEYKKRVGPLLFKVLVYIFAFIVFVLFIFIADIPIREYYPPEDWF